VNTEKENSNHTETEVTQDKGQNPEPTSPEPPSPPIQKLSKTRPVILYIVIMFGVALFLIILSFFMQQRNHVALMRGLSTSAMNVQTIVDLELSNTTLEEKLEKMTEQLNQSNTEKEAVKKTVASLEQQTKAMELFMELRLCHEKNQQEEAKELLAKMEKNGLVDALPTESTLPDHPSPREIFDELRSELS